MKIFAILISNEGLIVNVDLPGRWLIFGKMDQACLLVQGLIFMKGRLSSGSSPRIRQIFSYRRIILSGLEILFLPIDFSRFSATELSRIIKPPVQNRHVKRFQCVLCK